MTLEWNGVAELPRFCRTNLEYIHAPIRSIALEFQGLNRYEYFEQPSCGLELELAEAGVLYVIPYTAPWSWMNEAATRYTDWMLDNLFRVLELPQSTPIVSTGYSMGGLAAIIYPVYAKREIAACMANSPVCDLVRHIPERDDLPRTILNAFMASPQGLEEGVRSRSPVHQIDRLKDIPYLIVAGERDGEVFKARHSDRLAQMMRERGLRLDYRELPTMRHWQINDYATLRDAIAFVKGGYRDR